MVGVVLVVLVDVPAVESVMLVPGDEYAGGGGGVVFGVPDCVPSIFARVYGCTCGGATDGECSETLCNSADSVCMRALNRVSLR